jgi:DNA-binding XRE family transcriptional regulator
MVRDDSASLSRPADDCPMTRPMTAMEPNKKSMDVPEGTAAEEGAAKRPPPKPAKRASDRAHRTLTSSVSRSSTVTASKSKATSKQQNRVRETRIERMMSKAELARRAGISVLTIDRVEKGLGCRMDTKRKILEALGLDLADRVRVFGEEE